MGKTMRRSAPPRSVARVRRRVRTSHRSLTLAAVALAVGLCAPSGAQAVPSAQAGPEASLIVIPTPASGPSLSYFKLSLAHGGLAHAGTVSLRNPTRRRMRVALDPVDGKTINTLGSTYGLPRSHVRGPAGWVQLGRRKLTLAPGETVAVPVSVVVPDTATPGDYLSGVAVEQLGQQARSTARRGVSAASVVRYAIGVETSLPGPRHPLIRFTGARLERQPAGLAFLLDARNPGNVILQNVAGRALITRGSRVVARVPLGPGTFVTATSIAYPILAPRERPRQGTVYRVRAYLRYAGGIARLDTLVRFGRADALRQQLYGGPKASASSGLPGWLVALLSVLGLALFSVPVVLVMRRRRRGDGSPVRTIDAALRAARESGEPLSLISVSLVANGAAPGKLVSVLRSRLRHSDRLCRLDAQRFVVVAQDTDLQTADALAADLRRHLQRAELVAADVEIDVQEPDADASAEDLLQRIQTETRHPHTPTPAG
jgi:hypothetical protein